MLAFYSEHVINRPMAQVCHVAVILSTYSTLSLYTVT